eukprot:1148620-Pelagomonas_calceolata.AAC.2
MRGFPPNTVPDRGAIYRSLAREQCHTHMPDCAQGGPASHAAMQVVCKATSSIMQVCQCLMSV